MIEKKTGETGRADAMDPGRKQARPVKGVKDKDQQSTKAGTPREK